MNQSLICLTLTGKTIIEDLTLLDKYRKYVDLVELRADMLDENECLSIRRFPSLAKIPCILTIRRHNDGGAFIGGESSRTMLFARAMAFADQNPENNFTYVDFEKDFHIPSLQDAALAFGTKIIRSYHNMTGPVKNIVNACSKMRRTGYEIPKIAFMPHTLDDITDLFKETENFVDYDHILCAMGPLGFPTRVLTYKTHSYLTYVMPPEKCEELKMLGQTDPVSINEIYHFRSLDERTKLYGIMGYPLEKTSSPILHNEGYIQNGLNALYIPVRAKTVTEALSFAKQVGIKGFSVTVPFKEEILPELEEIDELTGDIGASNTIINKCGKWYGYNTDALGFMKALQEFLKTQKLYRRKVAIIGAGGASRAVAYAIKQMGGKACIFNRSVKNAKEIASLYGFDYAPLNPDSEHLVEKYSDIIIQTTSVGMGSKDPSSEKNDPLYFYNFNGTEKLYDIIYHPEETPIMKRAQDAGCKVSNGSSMLKYQGYEQFKLFTGLDYERNVTE